MKLNRITRSTHTNVHSPKRETEEKSYLEGYADAVKDGEQSTRLVCES